MFQSLKEHSKEIFFGVILPFFVFSVPMTVIIAVFGQLEREGLAAILATAGAVLLTMLAVCLDVRYSLINKRGNFFAVAYYSVFLPLGALFTLFLSKTDFFSLYGVRSAIAEALFGNIGLLLFIMHGIMLVCRVGLQLILYQKNR